MKTFRSVLITFVLLCLAAQVWAAPAAPVLSYETNGLNLSITWTQVPDATGYKLYYAPYPFPGPESIGSIDVGNLTSMHVALPEGAAYYIAVTAYDTSGAEGPFSNIEQFIITRSASDAPVLSVDTDGLYVLLSWTDVPGAAGYKLYYADDTAPESFQGFDAGGLTNISFYLWEGAAFYLKVTAYTSSGLESEFSNTEYFVMGPPTPEWVDDDGDGFIELDGDCDDTDASINPSALEVCGDGVDQDCDGMDKVCPVGANDVDDDGDGYTENQGDCNDGDTTVNPAAADICGDGIDQDCSGADRVCADPNDVDNDGDGYTENQGDCNDGNSSINPGATEICGDGIDQDCNGVDLVCGPNDIDDDNDGYTENQGDCNDGNHTLHPGATEICGDGIDQDCSGSDLACPVTCIGEVINPIPLSIGTPLNQTIAAYGTKYYVFEVSVAAEYTIALYNMTTDNDWKLGEYISNCEDDYTVDQSVIAASANLDTADDIQTVPLSPKKYLLVVDEWSNHTSSYTLSVTR